MPVARALDSAQNATAHLNLREQSRVQLCWYLYCAPGTRDEYDRNITNFLIQQWQTVLHALRMRFPSCTFRSRSLMTCFANIWTVCELEDKLFSTPYQFNTWIVRTHFVSKWLGIIEKCHSYHLCLILLPNNTLFFILSASGDCRPLAIHRGL